MFIVTLIILIISTIIVSIIDELTGAILLLLTIANIIALLCCIGPIVKGRVIDQKIEMYTEENAVIEDSIDKLVSQYMEYESSTLSEFNNESLITLVNLYPELKADELVQRQLSIYTQNNEKIRDLKEQKINIGVYNWWVYFGK